ncbi:MAG: UvrB/UvrC motif-containing protein, partial [Pseudomonas sp.]|nr:UvrB/UvrC motif-containing protein [Pseudomonas sp.]
SARLEFERAASLRDRIRALTHVQGSDRINLDGVTDADVVALHQMAGQSCVQVFFIRGGRNNGNRPYFLSHAKAGDSPEQVLGAFLAQLYEDLPPPPLILVSHEPKDGPVLAEALGAIGQMHAQGLWQADLHLDNLLRHEGRLYLIDGGGVRCEVAGQPLSRARVLENLGVFFAQLPAELDPFLEELLIHYLLANGEHALPLEMLQAEIAKVRRWRLRDYLKKAARDCSLFAARIGAFGLRVVRREAEADLQPLLHDLDARIEAGHIYKTGGAATVARVELDGRQLVVKRYNVKNWMHWLKRFWRPSRAWHSWIEGNRLELLGIATPRPLVVIERRWCWLRGRAYLITDYCGGQDIIARFEAYKQATPPENELLALDRLFAALLRERISHGDFKGHNLFWDDVQGAWSLIDLDAMRQHHSTRSFSRAYARDRARFLRNWPADSALHLLLDQRLPQVPGTCPN